MTKIYQNEKELKIIDNNEYWSTMNAWYIKKIEYMHVFTHTYMNIYVHIHEHAKQQYVDTYLHLHICAYVYAYTSM